MQFFCVPFLKNFTTYGTLWHINQKWLGAIPQKWIFACVNCGCISTTMAEKQTGICPVCKSSNRNTIEGFIY